MSLPSPNFESEFSRLYDTRLPIYEAALEQVGQRLRSILSDRDRHTVAEQRRMKVESGRIKEKNRLLVKALSAKYEEVIHSPDDVFRVITDITGIRVTCNTVEDVRRIETAIVESGELPLYSAVPEEKCHEDYVSTPKPSGYRAVHFLVEVEVPAGGGSEIVPCEVQIRTLLQHAWGELTHEDTFKPGVVVPPLVSALSQRLATALAVLDEIAQDLRDELNKIEKEQADTSRTQGNAATSVEPVDYDLIKSAFTSITGRILNATGDDLQVAGLDLAKANMGTVEQIADLFDEARSLVQREAAATGIMLSDAKLLEIVRVGASRRDRMLGTVQRLCRAEADRIARHAEFLERYAPGRIHMATVLRATPRYAIAQVSPTAQAIVSVRHLEEGRTRLNMEDFVSPGDSIRIQVVNSSAEEQRIEARLVTGVLT